MYLCLSIYVRSVEDSARMHLEEHLEVPLEIAQLETAFGCTRSTRSKSRSAVSKSTFKCTRAPSLSVPSSAYKSFSKYCAPESPLQTLSKCSWKWMYCDHEIETEKSSILPGIHHGPNPPWATQPWLCEWTGCTINPIQDFTPRKGLSLFTECWV